MKENKISTGGGATNSPVDSFQISSTTVSKIYEMDFLFWPLKHNSSSHKTTWTSDIRIQCPFTYARRYLPALEVLLPGHLSLFWPIWILKHNYAVSWALNHQPHTHRVLSLTAWAIFWSSDSWRSWRFQGHLSVVFVVFGLKNTTLLVIRLELWPQDPECVVLVLELSASSSSTTSWVFVFLFLGHWTLK